MRIANGDKLIMIGDSITDCGRRQPEGEGLGDTLGRGYVSLVDALLTAAYPERQIRVVNKGTSGHTVRDLKERWQRDVADLAPDWVSIMIGTNDVWRQFDLPRQPETHVYLEEYETTLDELVRQTAPRVKGLVLMTPFYLEPNRQDAMRAAMDRYGEVVRRVAAAHGTLFVDTQAVMDRLLAHIYPATIAWDRVHPSQAGHMALARAFLAAVGFEWQ